MLKKNGWVLEDPALIRLFERLMNQGTPLGEFVKGRIYRGVVTGLNEAFVIDKEKRDELIEENPRSAELIKPWLRGRDIRRWQARSPGLYIIFSSRGVDIDQYPAIREHLKWFRNDLEDRATAHLHPWYELQQPQEGIYQEFVHPKIVWPEFARTMRFSFDSTGSYVNNKCYILPTSDVWLLAVLNSSLIEFLLCQMANTLRGGFLQLYHHYTTSLPIMTLGAPAKTELESLTDEILGLEPSERFDAIEREIDSIVFHAYGLSPSERRLVLDWLDERSVSSNGEAGPDRRKLNALQASAGAWKDSIDGEQLKLDVRASREIPHTPRA